MHLTRPKSSKGRSRPAAAAAAAASNDSTGDHIPGSPESARVRNLRSQSQPSMTAREDQTLHLLWQRVPAAPPPSLNKYKVLPSIERRRRSEASAAPGGGGGSLDKRMSVLTLSDHAVLRQRQSHMEEQRADGSASIRPTPPEPDPQRPQTSGGAGANNSLLLAVRAPCGRRFEQHFESTDTLLMVRASAEVRFGQQYRQAFIETMDVPRRSFTDMDMTLDQCDIMNRSVLCITLNNSDSVVQHE